MTYVISDIHGDYNKWNSMLKKIKFCSQDELYVLGDVIDRGKNSLCVLTDMMERPNVYPILGNHEFMFLKCVKDIPFDASIDDFMLSLSEESIIDFSLWINDGGRPTFEEYMRLSLEKRELLLDYLKEFMLYDQIEVGGKIYLFTHSGLRNFSSEKEPEDYEMADFLFDRPEKERQFYSDRVLVFGHTPTLLQGENPGRIVKTDYYINVDCGCAYPERGGRLGCLCLESGAEFYV